MPVTHAVAATHDTATDWRALAVALDTRDEADVSWLRAETPGDGWALAPDALRLLSKLVPLLRPCHILEFGSGESTRVLARAAAALSRPAAVTVVEHDPRFVAATARKLEADGTNHVVRIQFAPLVARRRFDALVPAYRWDRRKFAVSGPVDLVLIDGPPRVLGGREGTLYQAFEVSRAGTMVLLDDAHRDGEGTAMEQWVRRLEAAIEVRMLDGFERGMAAVVVRSLEPLSRYLRHAVAASSGRPPEEGVL
jgi:predicted O-methyltransferase YrrM